MVVELASTRFQLVERNCQRSVEKLWESEVDRLKEVENRCHSPGEAGMPLPKALNTGGVITNQGVEGAGPRSGRDSLAQRKALGTLPS